MTTSFSSAFLSTQDDSSGSGHTHATISPTSDASSIRHFILTHSPPRHIDRNPLAPSTRSLRLSASNAFLCLLLLLAFLAPTAAMNPMMMAHICRQQCERQYWLCASMGVSECKYRSRHSSGAREEARADWIQLAMCGRLCVQVFAVRASSPARVCAYGSARCS
jgi:hypothetical protein